jgi:hypothetical protein
VKTQQFPAMRATRLFMQVAKTIGPALGALMQLDPETQLAAAGPELAGALANLDPDQAEKLVPEILGSTQAQTEDGKFIALNTKSNIDLVFSGRLMTMFQVLGFVLQVNFRDFTSGVSVAPKPSPAAAA